MSDRTGRCLCGAVRFVARDVATVAGICHCRMCQRWTGSAFVEVAVPRDKVTWDGVEYISVYTSSAVGERAFCRECGSHLYFRVTQEGEWSGNVDLPLGLFDDTSGFALKFEIFCDQKPATYAFEDTGQTRLTRAQVIEKFAALKDIEA